LIVTAAGVHNETISPADKGQGPSTRSRQPTWWTIRRLYRQDWHERIVAPSLIAITFQMVREGRPKASSDCERYNVPTSTMALLSHVLGGCGGG